MPWSPCKISEMRQSCYNFTCEIIRTLQFIVLPLSYIPVEMFHTICCQGIVK